MSTEQLNTPESSRFSANGRLNRGRKEQQLSPESYRDSSPRRKSNKKRRRDSDGEGTERRSSSRNRHRNHRRRRKNHRHRRRQHSESKSPEQRAGVVSYDEDENTSNIGGSIFTKHRSPSKHDDTIGHFQGRPGEWIQDRYRIIRQVGLGTFGRVLECRDRRFRDELVAIKVVRDIQRYKDSARIEADIVGEVNRRGGRGVSHIVRLFGSFTFGNHFCLAFESLGPSLYDFMKEHNYQPFPMPCVQDFCIQLLEALEFLHRLRLIHTDLKIENILLADGRSVPFGKSGRARAPRSTRIKLIDFGGSCYDDEHKSRIINTRQYRYVRNVFVKFPQEKRCEAHIFQSSGSNL